MKKRINEARRFGQLLAAGLLLVSFPAGIGPARAEEGKDTTVGQYQWMVVPEMNEALMPFEFHGYVRTGFGLNNKGGDQDSFWLPYAGGSYRLGNETGTYGDLSFAKNWGGGSKPWVRMGTGLKFGSESNLVWKDGWFSPNQVFVMFGNFSESYPDMRIWAGQRGYLWSNIHINQFVPWDQNGFGGGVEDINLCFGKLNINYVGAALANFKQFSVTESNGKVEREETWADGTANGRLAKQSFDVHLHDVDLKWGVGTFWVNLGYIPGGELLKRSGDGYQELGIHMSDGWGFSLGFMHTKYDFFRGTHKFLVQYGRGINMNLKYMTTSDDDVPQGDNGNAFAMHSAYRVRVADFFDMQPSECLSLMAAAVYEYTYRGGGAVNHWASFGVSPVWHLTEIFGVAFETGVDYVDHADPYNPKEAYSGYLAKVAVSPQITPTNSYWSRPLARAYIAYYKWSDEILDSEYLAAKIGGVGSREESFAVTYGVMAEAWW